MQVSTNNRYVVMAPDRAAVERMIKASEGKAAIVDTLPIVDGYVVESAPDSTPALFKSAVPGVTVVPDRQLQWIQPVDVGPSTDASGAVRGMAAETEKKVGVVSKTLKMEQVWARGYTGKGVGVAVLDSGIVNHDDFAGRIAAFKDFTDSSKDGQPWDPVGHGTHVAGDAAGSGVSSNGEYRGAAYEATILGLKIGGTSGPSLTSVVKAIQWAVDNKEKYNIRVMNMSFGGPGEADPSRDPVVIALNKAADAGITSFIAAGNEGPGKSTIGSPGYAPRAVTVGASDDRKTESRADDTIARFSSRGPAAGRPKPDVAAPGVRVMAPDSSSTNRYVAMSGTSMASPVAMGVAATWLQANPKLTTEQLKEIIARSSEPMAQGGTPSDQGAGLIDAAKGLDLALALRDSGMAAVLATVPGPAAAAAAAV